MATEYTIDRTLERIQSEEQLTGLLGPTDPGPQHPHGRTIRELIVRRVGRPVLDVVNGTIEPPIDGVWRAALLAARDRLLPAVTAVGRIELCNAAAHVGTGWLIAEDIIVTNRHVAELFVLRDGLTHRLVPGCSPPGPRPAARIDFLVEVSDPRQFEVELVECLHMAPSGHDHPDLAFLRVRRPVDRALPPPIPLASAAPRPDQPVAVVGYPAADGRHDDFLDQWRLFRGRFDVKRLSPGTITEVHASGDLRHDCTTLGGSSGSPVISLAPESAGQVVGLHFAGHRGPADVYNVAVSCEEVRYHLERFVLDPSPIAVDSTPSEPEPSEPSADTRERLAEREGYDPAFLGEAIALAPIIAAHQADLASVGDTARAEGGSDGGDSDESPDFELRYTHFSVVMSKTRRLARVTAVNIDGNRARRVRRGRDRWRFDPRIDASLQLGNELYRRNPLDRGHLVRRLDPAWGSVEQARRASDDTFYWTNCSPQHSAFNQRVWLGLEDYILEHTDNHDLKVTVFTGPLFRDDDPEYRGLARLPRAYWKVVLMNRHDEAGPTLHATAYLIGQSHLIDNLEFTFGRYRTYQMSVQHIEGLTGLDFGERVRQADPLHGLEARSYRALDDLDDITI